MTADPPFELQWRGKYGADGERSPIPSQRAELRLDERWAGGEGNAESEVAAGRLVEAENLAALNALAAELEGEVAMVYADPPFLTELDFRYALGRPGSPRRKLRAFSDKWRSGLPGYLEVVSQRLRVLHRLLRPGGALYLHTDPRTAHALRFVCDEVFGPAGFVNELIWMYRTGGVPEKLGFGRKHDVILFYVKGRAEATWNRQREKSYLSHRYGFTNVEIHEDERGPYTLVNARDVLDVPALRGNHSERVDYPTQKPEALLERLILASTAPGDLLLDPYAGSGTSCAVAARLGRRWLAIDEGAWAIRTTRNRLRALGAGYELWTERPPQPAPDVQLELRGEDALEVALQSFAPAPAPDGLGCEGEGLSWLDGWSLGPDRLPFEPRWSCARRRAGEALPLESAPLCPREGLVLQTTDLFGRRQRLRLRPKAPPRESISEDGDEEGAHEP